MSITIYVEPTKRDRQALFGFVQGLDEHLARLASLQRKTISQLNALHAAAEESELLQRALLRAVRRVVGVPAPVVVPVLRLFPRSLEMPAKLQVLYAPKGPSDDLDVVAKKIVLHNETTGQEEATLDVPASEDPEGGFVLDAELGLVKVPEDKWFALQDDNAYFVTLRNVDDATPANVSADGPRSETIVAPDTTAPGAPDAAPVIRMQVL